MYDRSYPGDGLDDALDLAEETGEPIDPMVALLCRFHHRLVHEYGWELLVDDAGHWVAIDPHGTTCTGRPAAPELLPAQARAPDRPTYQDPE